MFCFMFDLVEILEENTDQDTTRCIIDVDPERNKNSQSGTSRSSHALYSLTQQEEEEEEKRHGRSLFLRSTIHKTPAQTPVS